MDAQKQPQFVTLVAIAAAWGIAFVPGLEAWFVYDRDPILHGEIWRLFTGHWVHFSTSHLIYDSVPFGIAGWILEQKCRRRFGWFCAVGPWVISLALLIFEPGMRFYGGLSGLATGAVVLLCAEGFRKPQWRWVSVMGLAEITIKTAMPTTLFATFGGSSVEVSQLGHLAGGLTGLAALKIRPSRAKLGRE